MVHITHKHPIRVRYAETDKMGFVWNGNYFTYFEIGRTELMRHYGLRYADLENSGYLLPLVETYAKYIMPGLYDDLLYIESSLVYEGGAILKFEYNIIRDDTTIAKGYTVHSFMNSVTKRPVKPPKLFIDLIEKLARNI